MKTDVIQQILNRDNYANDEWEKRGVTPSEETVIQILNSSTKSFLLSLESLPENIDATELNSQVLSLVDALPWDRLDREEKDFLADVLAPAIESLGLDPWQLY